MILKIDNLSKWYGGEQVLDKINFMIEEPQIIALVAPNGAGKSTLMNLICNLEKPSEGHIEVFGKPSTDYKNFWNLTYMQDNSVLYDNLNGWDHIQLIIDSYNLSKDTALKILQELEMDTYMKKKVKNYSLGMKQHLLFAMAIMPTPKLLILDEPINGLDPTSVTKVRNILTRMYKEHGTTVLFSSHNLDQVDKLTDNLLFLHKGNILSSDKLALTDRIDYKMVTVRAELLTFILNELSLSYEVLTPYKVSVTVAREERELIEKRCQERGITLLDIEQINNTAERQYLELFGERA